MTRPGHLAAKPLRNDGSSTARVPTTTSLAPTSTYACTAAASRTPPPTCTGTSPAATTMASTKRSFTGRPANAPSKSTTCKRRAPASTQRRAMPAGSSE